VQVAFIAEPHAPQQPQLMRHRRLRDPEQVGEIADGDFRPRERVENPHARRVAEDLERFSQRRRRLVVQQPFLHRNI
jgi:hypothetical protein